MGSENNPILEKISRKGYAKSAKRDAILSENFPQRAQRSRQVRKAGRHI